MDIVLLAAGSSQRMGRINKLLVEYEGTTLVCHSAIQALRFLEKEEGTNRLIVVTGYRRQSTEKALKPCKDFIEKTKASLELIIVNNPSYRKGQFTSVQVGVEQVTEGSNFFINLADMPLIKAKHYKKISELLGSYDAVRPFYKTEPGHPVYHSAKLKNIILKAKGKTRVSEILKDFKVLQPDLKDKALICDVDTISDLTEFKIHA